ncbi:MAG TPA: hypothetical protein PKH69_07835 [Thiobacillaceae bacterium]|nr:hypothetical protein [Thiobacillaceae bacterium]HNU63990.1 hypothetical protein [Thiobacillaceae bacterium]
MHTGHKWLYGVCGLCLALGQVHSLAAGDSPRLKYRAKGSVCACDSGLSEADIRRAMAGLERLRDVNPKPGEDKTKHSDSQTRREANEAFR